MVTKEVSAHAQHHMQRLCLGNRCMSAASIAAEVEGVGGSACQCSDTEQRLILVGLDIKYIECFFSIQYLSMNVTNYNCNSY